MALEWHDFDGRSLLDGPELRGVAGHLWFSNGRWVSNTPPVSGDWPTLEAAKTAIVQALLKDAVDQLSALSQLAPIPVESFTGLRTEPVAPKWDEVFVAQHIEAILVGTFGIDLDTAISGYCAEKLMELIRKVVAESYGRTRAPLSDRVREEIAEVVRMSCAAVKNNLMEPEEVAENIMKMFWAGVAMTGASSTLPAHGSWSAGFVSGVDPAQPGSERTVYHDGKGNAVDPPPHQLTGVHCLVGHRDADGKVLPACRKCSTCGGWVAYDKQDEVCPGKSA